MSIVTDTKGETNIDLDVLVKEIAQGWGREAQVIDSQNLMAKSHFTIPYSTQTDLHKFCILAETWKKETKHLSFISQIALHPAYQQIIGMGEKAIPFILEDLQLIPHHWFWALKAITGIDPVHSSDYGNIQKMAKSWVDWGRQNGFII